MLLTKVQALDLIRDELLDAIHKYYETKTVQHVTLDIQDAVKRVWEGAIQPGQTWQVGCGGCYKMALDIIGSWFERERSQHSDPYDVDRDLITREDNPFAAVMSGLTDEELAALGQPVPPVETKTEEVKTEALVQPAETKKPKPNKR